MGESIKRYQFNDDWQDFSIELEVDHDQLTTEVATEINNFWSGAKERVSDAGGSVVNAVIKMAADTLARSMLSQGGACFSSEDVAAIWTKQDLHDQEGWGGSELDSPYGYCGIRLIEADVAVEIDMKFG
ncbi:DUF2528 family protein [uncultured Deefgea sp.]|uniref:DUF2528 family protein n=1 Tax=uncultured Deefgea sp. TaxID=1304914 RepID=UPI002593A09D|nr:DUF2528 family protein [uncultured Deefgea sp.]